VIDLVAVRLGRQYLAKHGISTETQVKVEQGLQVLSTQQRETDTECAVAVASTSGSAPLEEAIPSRAESTITAPTPSVDRKEPDYWTDSSEGTPAGAQILGVAILEFGILFHSVCPLPRSLLMVGNHWSYIALAGGSEFTTLYIVIIFHRTSSSFPS
jgi:hypothetical protein